MLLLDESLIGAWALMMMMIACCLTPVNLGCAIHSFYFFYFFFILFFIFYFFFGSYTKKECSGAPHRATPDVDKLRWIFRA